MDYDNNVIPISKYMIYLGIELYPNEIIKDENKNKKATKSCSKINKINMIFI